VDTKFTKKFGRSRLKVAVLDPNLIPDLVNVVIGDYVYKLQFKVEQDMPSGEPEVIDMDTKEEKDPKEKDPRGEKPEEDMEVDGNKEEDQVPNNENGNQLPNSSKQTAASGAAELDDAGAATKIHQSKPVQASIKPVMVLSQNGMSPNCDGLWKANMMSSQYDSGLLNKTNVINSGTLSPVRSSKRNASTADQDSIEKASKLKARKNLDTAPGKGYVQGNALAPAMGKITAA
jgi:hypothetical protein